MISEFRFQKDEKDIYHTHGRGAPYAAAQYL